MQRSNEAGEPLLQSSDKMNEVEKFLYKGIPGCHLADSPVVGSRYHEAKAIIDIMSDAKHEASDLLTDLNENIYMLGDFLYRIPESQISEANVLAHDYFSNYIKKYQGCGFTTENIVHWLETRNRNENITTLHTEDDGVKVWYIEPKVERYSRLNRNYDQFSNTFSEGMLPRGVTAWHELMHAEEIQKNGNTHHCLELLTSLRSQILVDAIYKQLNNIPINEVVYCGRIRIKNRKIPFGELINFYRALEAKEGSLCKAILSRASLNYLATAGTLIPPNPNPVGHTVHLDLAENPEEPEVKTNRGPSPTRVAARATDRSPLLQNHMHAQPPVLQTPQASPVHNDGCCEPDCFSWLKNLFKCK